MNVRTERGVWGTTVGYIGDRIAGYFEGTAEAQQAASDAWRLAVARMPEDVQRIAWRVFVDTGSTYGVDYVWCCDSECQECAP